MGKASRLTRRGFLGLAAALGAGCTLAPGRPGWGLTTWAEGLGAWLWGRARGALAKEYGPEAITAAFPIRSLSLPEGYAAGLDGWALTVEGLVEAPRRWTLAELRAAFPRAGHVTRHDCVEGWSAIARFDGVRLADLVAAVRPTAEARWVVFHAADFDGRSGAPFYGSLALADAVHPQTVLAYEMNGAPLSIDHGAPLRLRVPTQLGYKSTKFIHRIAFVASLEGLGKGKGGYWEDAGYEHWAGV